MKKRKIIAVILTIATLIGAVSCAQEESSSRRRSKKKKRDTKVEKVEETEAVIETAATTAAPTESEITYETEVAKTYPASNNFQVNAGSDYKGLEFYTDSTFTEVAAGYRPNADGIYIKFQTCKFYDKDACFYVDVKINGNLIVDDLEGAVRDPIGTDWGDISLTGPIPAGDYEIIITGFDGYIFGTAYFTVE